MVIIHEKVVFLAITGATTERTKALGIEDEVSGEYFSAYYQHLYDAGTPARGMAGGHPFPARDLNTQGTRPVSDDGWCEADHRARRARRGGGHAGAGLRSL
jgi:hypothetical protein